MIWYLNGTLQIKQPRGLLIQGWHYILTSKCASRHNGVHFFDVSTSKSGPDLVCFVHFYFEMCFAPQQRAIFHPSSGQLAPTRRFSEPTFRPSGASNHWKKHSVSRLSYLFAHLNLLSSDSFSFLFSSLLWLFPSLRFICPYCRKFDFETSFDNKQIAACSWRSLNPRSPKRCISVRDASITSSFMQHEACFTTEKFGQISKKLLSTQGPFLSRIRLLHLVANLYMLQPISK